MCMPREPLVFGQPRRPISSSSALTSRATRRTSSHGTPGPGIEIDPQFIRMFKIAGANWMRVQFNAAKVDDPRKSGGVIDDDFFRGAPGREGQASRSQPGRPVRRARASDRTPRPRRH